METFVINFLIWSFITLVRSMTYGSMNTWHTSII